MIINETNLEVADNLEQEEFSASKSSVDLKENLLVLVMSL